MNKYSMRDSLMALVYGYQKTHGRQNTKLLLSLRSTHGLN